MWGLHRQNDEGDCEAQCHGWGGSIRFVYCDRGKPSDGRMWKPNKGMHTADGTHLCNQHRISKGAEEHVWSFSKTFFWKLTGQNYWKRSTASKISSCSRHTFPLLFEEDLLSGHTFNGVVMECSFIFFFFSLICSTHRHRSIHSLSAHSIALWFPPDWQKRNTNRKWPEEFWSLLLPSFPPHLFVSFGRMLVFCFIFIQIFDTVHAQKQPCGVCVCAFDF